MARHWAEVGFGTPVVMHLFYVVKILLYILGGWLFALATAGINGFTNICGRWWTEPIVFEKIVLYTMLFEVVGLGCGFGPLNNRFVPPLLKHASICPRIERPRSRRCCTTPVYRRTPTSTS